MKKGMTMVALIATIIITIILVSTVVFSYNNIIANTKKNEFAREIYTVQKMVKDYEFKNNEYPLLEEVNVLVSSLDNNFKIQFSGEVGYTEGNIKLNKIDLYKADISELTRGTSESSDDIYLFSKTTKKVYYLKGIRIEGNVYYTLTDELYKLINISEVN